jgi:hypothetical protein
MSKKYQPANPINAVGQKEIGSKAVDEIRPNIVASR